MHRYFQSKIIVIMNDGLRGASFLKWIKHAEMDHIYSTIIGYIGFEYSQN